MPCGKAKGKNQKAKGKSEGAGLIQINSSHLLSSAIFLPFGFCLLPSAF
jgi:hypothetical protein